MATHEPPGPAEEPHPGSPEVGYKVGPRCPPREHRFKKGRSGNPGGRPPKAKNLATHVAQALDQVVPVTENGRRHKRPKREVIIAQLINRAAAGDLKAIALLFSLSGKFEAAKEAGQEAPTTSTTDQEVLDALIARLRNEGGGDGGDGR